jgi:REP element-mobilizing transposase RayT
MSSLLAVSLAAYRCKKTSAPAAFAFQEHYPFRLYGYCLMHTHFHLLLEPDAGQNISWILPSLTVAHTWRFHRGHWSSGQVWQGRFQSPVIQDDAHLLTALRYIEAKPLRAGLVTDLMDYPWCSYPTHGLGRLQELVNELLPQAISRKKNRRQIVPLVGIDIGRLWALSGTVEHRPGVAGRCGWPRAEQRGTPRHCPAQWGSTLIRSVIRDRRSRGTAGAGPIQQELMTR